MERYAVSFLSRNYHNSCDESHFDWIKKQIDNGQKKEDLRNYLNPNPAPLWPAHASVCVGHTTSFKIVIVSRCFKGIARVFSLMFLVCQGVSRVFHVFQKGTIGSNGIKMV